MIDALVNMNYVAVVVVAIAGFFVGVTVVGVRRVNGGLWEGRSLKLLLITVGHEVALYPVQGALLGAWR